nr:MAG TPA: hypothetical protein [Caudoviricetes sp.]
MLCSGQVQISEKCLISWQMAIVQFVTEKDFINQIFIVISADRN